MSVRLSISDVYRQQSAVAFDEVSLINAQNTFDKSIADLISLIGLDVTEEYTLPIRQFLLTSIQQNLQQQLNHWAVLTICESVHLISRQDYQSAVENMKTAGYGVTQAWGHYLPSVNSKCRI